MTGFGKTAEVPEDPSELLALPAGQNFVMAGDTVGAFVGALLLKGPSWKDRTPNAQAKAQKAAAVALAAAVDAERRKQEADKQAIEVMNDLSASPASAFGPHTMRTHADIYVWGSLTCCWDCNEPMLVWDARTWAWGGGMPSLQVKSEVDRKRLENHPEVHRAVDNWIRAVRPDVKKAVIEKRCTKASGRLYSAFVCPSCDRTMGQFFISCIRPEKWSLLGSPAEVLPPPTRLASATMSTAPPIPVRCRIHETPKEECDWCQKRPAPRWGKRY